MNSPAASMTGRPGCRRRWSNRRRPIWCGRRPPRLHRRQAKPITCRRRPADILHASARSPAGRFAPRLMPSDLWDETGWKPIDVNGQRRVVRCDCWRDNVGYQRLAEANIPRRYQHCTIANFTAYNESLERAARAAQKLAEAFPAVTKGLLLEG